MKNENRKVLFIINKFSGTGYKPSVEGKIIQACSALKYECSIEFTTSRGHATTLAKMAVKNNFDCVFAVGGDGTVNEVAQGLMNSSVAMGILPKGSGNGLARHLGVSTRFDQALSLIGSDQTIPMDTLLVNDKVSVNVSGVGFDGHVAGLFGTNGQRGLINYTRLVIKEFKKYQEFEAELIIDGVTFKRKAFLIAFANSSQFGNNARVAPLASVCDQLMDISIVRKIPLVQSVGFASKMFSGNLGKSRFVELLTGRQITVRFQHPVSLHIDGEGMDPLTELNIQVIPGSLKMLIPAQKAGKV